ncbi:MAG: response regulator [Chloroflexota bacterium]
MPGRGDILIVENDPLVLEGNQLLFELEGYRVFTAVSVAEAVAILDHNHIDLAVIDVRLSNDHDTYDRSGIELAEQMPPEVAKVLITAFHKFEYRSSLPQNLWHLAKQAGPAALVDKVARIFRDTIRLNRQLDIDLAPKITTESLVQQMKPFRDLEGEALTETSDELSKLFCRLFLREKRIYLSPLKPGYGGAGVALVRPFYPTKGAYVVVKFGLREQIAPEVENYREYVEPYIQLNATEMVGDMAQTRRLAGVRYRFIGAQPRGQTQDFASVYFDETRTHDSIKDILVDLFEDSCGLWYDGKQEWSEGLCPKTAVDCYKEQLGLCEPEDWQQLKEAQEKMLQPDGLFARHSATELKVAWPPNRVQILPDPVCFVETYADKLPLPARYCITHGDLNGNNVFVDEDSHTWLIDFSRTGWGPALRDVTELETVIKYEFLAEDDVFKRLAFEDIALAPDWFRRPLILPDELSKQFAYVRAHAAIQQIRYSAAQIAETDAMTAYWVGLLFYALKFVSWDETTRRGALLSLPIRQQALYGAARLCQRLAAFL